MTRQGTLTFAEGTVPMNSGVLKYKSLGYEGGHYIIGLYIDWQLIAKFKGYPDRNPDFLVLYFDEFVNFKRNVNTAKRKVHFNDIEF